MKIVLLAALVIFGVLSVSADICSTSYSNCKTCTADSNCGWCGPVGTCYNGTKSGPDVGVCYGDSWFYNFGNSPRPCPDCDSFSTCKQCLYWDADCAWCSRSQTCKEWGSTIGCGAVDTCPCDVYSTCSDCIKDNGCFWCASNSTCMNNGASCNMPAHTCPCSDNVDCRSCLDDDSQACVWCEGSTTGCQKSTSGCLAALSCNAYCENTGTTCSKCNDLTGCSWCSTTSSCVDNTMTNACSGPYTHSCPNCAGHRYCDTCTDEGCVWCSSGECREPDNYGNCLIAHTCNSYCSSNKDCSTCNGVQGCGWCPDSDSCVDEDSSSCALARGCSNLSCGFDGGAFVGGMFLGIGLCVIGVGGYLFYKWKVGKKPGYSELH